MVLHVADRYWYCSLLGRVRRTTRTVIRGVGSRGCDVDVFSDQ